MENITRIAFVFVVIVLASCATVEPPPAYRPAGTGYTYELNPCSKKPFDSMTGTKELIEQIRTDKARCRAPGLIDMEVYSDLIRKAQERLDKEKCTWRDVKYAPPRSIEDICPSDSERLLASRAEVPGAKKVESTPTPSEDDPSPSSFESEQELRRLLEQERKKMEGVKRTLDAIRRAVCPNK